MPVPVAVAAAYAAMSNALPAAVPFIGTAAVAMGIVMTHEPNKIDEAQLTRGPEPAAECIRSNIASLKTHLAAVVQPLQGTQTMGVVLKEGVVGDPLMSIVIQQAGTGSRAEFRPLTAPQQQPDVIKQMIAGC